MWNNSLTNYAIPQVEYLPVANQFNLSLGLLIFTSLSIFSLIIILKNKQKNKTITKYYYGIPILLLFVGILSYPFSQIKLGKPPQGEKQRVAICRALLTQPKLLLADEATGNLDRANKERIMLAIFVDVKTAWIIEGLGHGHLDLAKSGTPDVILKQESGNIAANAKLPEYNEITSENLDSFHFHGDKNDFPLTAIIAIPETQKSEALLRGKYQAETSTRQIVKPTQTIEELLLEVFKIRNILNAIFILVIFTTAIAIILIFNLSLRLRQGEMKTNFYLGCSRSTITKLIMAEILIIVLISSSLTWGITLGVQNFNRQVIRALIL